MTLIEDIISGNCITLVLICFFYSFLFTNNTLDKKIIYKFKFVATIILILMVSDIIDYICSTIDTTFAISVRYMTTTIGYLLRQAGMICLIYIFQQDDEKQRLYYYIPFLINAGALVINICYPLMFRYSGTQYVREAFGYLPHIVSGVYLIMVIAIIIKRFKRVNRNEKIMLLFTGLAITGAVTIETKLEIYFIVNPVALSSAIFYYLYLYTNISKIDSLTGLYNRKTFFTSIQYYLKDYFVLVNIDMNNLKTINDNIGHSAGDEALREISKIIIKNLLLRCNAYRMGGDEFIIVCPKYKIDEIQNMVGNISKEIEQKDYSIAYGIALYEKGMCLDEVLKESDDSMYAKKREMKQKANIIKLECM